MIQWFRGELDASYVGTPNPQPYFGAHPSGTHFKLHVYRAALKNLEPIEPPLDEADAQAQTSVVGFRQARVDDALIAGVRGPGTSYQGPIFELRVSEPRFSHALQQNGRAYGRLRGRALLYCDLPAESPQPPVETALVAEPAAQETEPAHEPLRAELRRAPSREQAQAAESEPTRARAPEDVEESEALAAPEKARPIVHKPRSDSAAPLFALATAVAIGLWVSCGGQPALLWCLFILPTLVARKLFHDVLPDNAYMRGFGALLAIVQLFCVSSLVSEWWSVPCKELHLLPLIGIVGVIFPAGILASVYPLVFNAAGLALVLAVWCGGGDACKPKPSSFAPASVEHPGVPRTNEDGTWPRRPPGR